MRYNQILEFPRDKLKLPNGKIIYIVTHNEMRWKIIDINSLRENFSEPNNLLICSITRVVKGQPNRAAKESPMGLEYVDAVFGNQVALKNLALASEGDYVWFLGITKGKSPDAPRLILEIHAIGLMEKNLGQSALGDLMSIFESDNPSQPISNPDDF